MRLWCLEKVLDSAMHIAVMKCCMSMRMSFTSEHCCGIEEKENEGREREKVSRGMHSWLSSCPEKAMVAGSNNTLSGIPAKGSNAGKLSRAVYMR